MFGAKGGRRRFRARRLPGADPDEGRNGRRRAGEQDNTAVAALVAKGVKPVRLVYADGGQNPYFANKGLDESRPDALAEGPREIVLGNDGKPLPAVVEVAAATKSRDIRQDPVARAPRPPAAATAVAAAAPASNGGLLESGKSLMSKLFRTAASDTPPAVQVFEPQTADPLRRAVAAAPRRLARRAGAYGRLA